MKKFILTLLAGGACCTLLAADFWQNKKFTEWDEKEVKKVLQDSPCWPERSSCKSDARPIFPTSIRGADRWRLDSR